jgi:iron complex outermembrane receptor protein
LATISFAQTGKIKGKITTGDQNAAPFVNVQIKGTNKGTVTDAGGNFIIRNVEHGSHILVVSFVGLGSKEVPVEISGQITVIENIILDENSEELEEIVILGSRSYKEDIVSPSLKLNTPLLELPQNVQTITGKMLTDQQIISMSDNVIRNVSGTVRLEHWADLYTNIMMRGSQVQAFRNGFNVVNSYWGPLTEDMSFVDRIEFVKGPAGFMLASGDPSGLYNVVTKKPTGQSKGEATFTLGSFDLYRSTLDLDGKLSKDGKVLFRLNLAGQKRGSHRPLENNDRYAIAPVISWKPTEKTTLTLEYTLQHAKMSNVGSYYVFSPDGYAKLPVDHTHMSGGLDPTRIDDQSVFVNLQHDLNNDWKLTAQLAYIDYQQVGSSMWPSTVNPDGTMIRNVSIWDAQSGMTLGQVFLTGAATTGPVSHRILTGIDVGSKNYEADWSQGHELDTPEAPFDPANPNNGIPPNGYPDFDRSLNLEARAMQAGGLMDQRYTGFYFQDELGFWDNKLRLTLAGRYTEISQSAWGGSPDKADHFTPRVGLSFSVDKQTSIYAMHDQAFIPQSGRLTSGNKVRPITGSNTEFGVKKDWADGNWNTTISVYQIRKNNELTADPNLPPSSNSSVVLGEKRAEGVEFDVKGNIYEGLNIVANYAYTDSKVNEGTEGTNIDAGDVVPGFAKHTVNTWLSYKIQSGALNGTGFTAGFSYMADRATAMWSDTHTNLPDYFRVDAGMFWEKDNVRVTLNVFNVLDKYLYSGSYYEWLSSYYWQSEPPRNFRMSVGYRF